MIARESAQECVALIEIAKRRGLISTELHLSLYDALEVSTKMLAGLITGLDRRQTP